MKCFDGWAHLVVMLYAVIMRFDSLREITASLQAEARKLCHLSISVMTFRSTLADADKRRPDTITLFSNLLFKGVGRHPKTGKKKGGIKVHTVVYANEGVPSDIRFTSAATNDSFMLKPSTLSKGDIMAIDRAYIDYEKCEQNRQNFPLKHFYGESANAIKIQIWVTIIASLLLMIMQKGLTRSWSFPGLAIMVRITLMYYVDFYSLFNHPEKDWESILEAADELPHQPSLFD